MNEKDFVWTAHGATQILPNLVVVSPADSAMSVSRLEARTGCGWTNSNITIQSDSNLRTRVR